MKTIKYSSIGQFRNVIKDVQYIYGEGILPILTFTGTVKAHGTNASVIISKDGEQCPQSRNNILTIGTDNCCFAAWHNENRHIFDRFYKMINIDKDIVIYGEWCGKGIKKNVAISNVDKFFYVFGVKVINDDNEHYWLKDYSFIRDEHSRIINANDVGLFSINIDFNDPKQSQNELISITNSVEEKCPIGELFGIIGTGEGVVWECINDVGEKVCFKVKGAKHSVTKVKELAEVDTEKLRSIQEFIDYAVTENRLQQGFSEACNNNPDRKLLGTFIKWVSTDVKKEEPDTLEVSNLTMKDIGSPLSQKAKSWFFEQIL